eukprot:GHRR01020581.1.p1 GENE.GHRR01020581.1~~GHRR01020581.1.p1  ORF type:complete len:394 (+),score=84.45 GHRR01020581.1:401-1582(+)
MLDAMRPMGLSGQLQQHSSLARGFRRSIPPVCRVTTKPQTSIKGNAKTQRGQAGTNKRTLSGMTLSGKTLSGKTQSGRQTVPGTQSSRQQRAEEADRKGSRFYFNITGFPFPIGPFFNRRTIRNEIVRGQVWTLEQTQAFFFDVFTPVRMTVIKLRSGGLWVHAPLAPTQELLNLLKELDAPVEYIVLPTFAYEHKVFVGPFSRRFPNAKVYVAPFQWSFPLNLPPQFFGIFPAGVLNADQQDIPWRDEIDYKVLLPPPIGINQDVRLAEVSFFHKATKTLMVTDAVVYVDKDPPACIPEKALKSQAQDGWLQKFLNGGRTPAEIKAIARKGPVEDTLDNRRIAWARMSLLVLYFNPSGRLSGSAVYGMAFTKPFCRAAQSGCEDSSQGCRTA